MKRIVSLEADCDLMKGVSQREDTAFSNPSVELSVRRWARTKPMGVALRGPEGELSWEEAARRISGIIDAWCAESTGKTRTKEPGEVEKERLSSDETDGSCADRRTSRAFSPLRLVARADERTVLTIWAALEVGRPLILLSGKLTTRELDVLTQTLNAIDEPLPEGTAVVMFTSGTTGRAKPAMISREALIASARANAANLPLTDADVWQLAISPARIGGFSILSRCLMAGAGIALSGGFRVDGFLRSLEEDRVTVASIVPTMLAKILDEAPEARVPATLRTLLVGGAAMPLALRRRAVEAGWPVMTTYGMTETASNVVTTPFAERFLPADSLGLPNAGVEIDIRKGEVWVKGEMLATGYWGGQRFDPNAWYPTGDLGEWAEDGRLRVLARRTDLILSGGENVYPVEVENALETISGIRAARVVGLPDPVWGAIVTALIVTADEGPSNLEIVSALKEKLAPYKCPRRLARVGALPVTAAGKPERRPFVLEGLDLEVLHYKRVV